MEILFYVMIKIDVAKGREEVMKYPSFLGKKGNIGFVAPSFGCNIEPYRTAFEHALERFHAMGYQTVLGPNCYEGAGIGISNTPQKCAKELTEAYQSTQSNVLMSCGGGEMMCEILEHIDWEGLKKAAPKWYMGYSDNTNFTFLLTTILDTASIYGPCAPTFGMEPWHDAVSDAMQLITGNKTSMRNYPFWEKESLKSETNPLLPYNVTEPGQIRSFVYKADSEVKDKNNAGNYIEEKTLPVTFEGRLIGGCMDCLVNLLGTEFDYVNNFNEKYKNDGFIWYLEACDLNIMGIRRAVWQMIHAGWFQYVKGFLIGRPYFHGQTMFGSDQYHSVLDLLERYQVPVIMDVDLGHLPPMMPIVNGSYAKVNTHGNNLQIDMIFK